MTSALLLIIGASAVLVSVLAVKFGFVSSVKGQNLGGLTFWIAVFIAVAMGAFAYLSSVSVEGLEIP